jgi:hypothetical protein
MKRMLRMHIRPRISMLTPAVMLALMLAAPSAVFGQTDEAAPPDGQAASSTPADVRPKELPRRWLLREGSLLVRARGTMDRDPATRWWQFTIRDEVDTRIRQTLGLLPCSLLDEMTRVQESLPGREIVFEVTGQIYVYRGRNFLLPTVAPQLIEYGPPATTHDDEVEGATSEKTTREDGGTNATDADDAGPARDSGDSVEDIVSELESSVGALARTTALPAGAETPVPGGFDSLVHEQTMLLSRRGRVSRGSTGAWLFVFDADAQGLADPPMVLMPCLLLEHLEQRVWRSGASVPVLISGRAYVYDNRNYLMPTAFQIAREQTPMNR